MSSFERIIRRARAREVANQAIHHAGWGLAVAIGLGTLLLGVDRLAGLRLPDFIYWAVLAAGAVSGAFVALLNRPDRFAVSVRLDRELRLKDRLGTATAVDRATHNRARQGNAAFVRAWPAYDPDFTELVARQAQEFAAKLDIRSATPIRLTPVWRTVIPMGLLLVVGVLYLPTYVWPQTGAAKGVSSELAQETRAQAQAISTAINQAVAEIPRDEFPNEADQANLDALDQLAQQLAQSPAEPAKVDSARDESAARLNEVAQRLAEQSQRDIAAADELARRFAGLDASGAPKPPMNAKEFDEALKRGDFGAAAQQLDRILKEQSIAEADRTEIAEHLRDLAKRIDPEADAPIDSSLPNERRAQLEQALRDQGLQQQEIDELLKERQPENQEQLAEELKRRNIDEDIARQLAHDIEEDQQQQRVEEQVAEDAKEISDALERAAGDIQSPPPPPPQPNAPDSSTQERQPPEHQQRKASEQSEQQHEERQQQQQQPEANKPDSTSDQSPQSQPQRGEQQQRQQQQQGQQKKDQRPSNQQGSQTEQQQEPQSQSTQPDAGAQPQRQPAPSPSADPSKQQQPRQQKPAPSQDQPQQGDKPESTAPGKDQTGTEQQSEQQTAERREGPPRQQEEQQQQAQDAQQEQQQQQQPNGQSPPSASEALRRFAERRQAAEDRQQSSQRLREAARQLAERMTPEEREQWARQWERQAGADERRLASGQPDPTEQDAEQRREARGRAENQPGHASGDPQTAPAPERLTAAPDDVDLRGKEAGEQTIARWLSDQPPEGAPGSANSGGAQRVRSAQEVAERAVNESAVQRRYHKAIKRYFDRLNQTVEKAAGEASAPPAAPGRGGRP